MPFCPTPDKVQYSKKDATTFVNAHPERELRTYPCPCGWWHLTHKVLGNGGKAKEIKLKYWKKFQNLINSVNTINSTNQG